MNEDTFYLEIELDKYVGADSKFYAVFGEKRAMTGTKEVLEVLEEVVKNLKKYLGYNEYDHKLV